MKNILTTTLIMISCIMLVAFSTSERSDLERNKALVKDFIDANYIHFDWSTVEKLTHKDFKQYAFDKLVRDYEGLKARFAERTPGKVIYHNFIAEGNKVAIHYTATFSPKIYQGVDIFTIKDGKVIEIRAYSKRMDS